MAAGDRGAEVGQGDRDAGGDVAEDPVEVGSPVRDVAVDAPSMDGAADEDAPEVDAAPDASEPPRTGRSPDADLALLLDTGLEAHNPITPVVVMQEAFTGYGAVPADVDGDGDIDLFLGTYRESAVRACVYENTSTPGAVRFERRDDWCAGQGSTMSGGTHADLDGDGIDELVLFDSASVFVVRLAEAGWRAELVGRLAAGCFPGAALVTDLDADGERDIIVSCSVHERVGVVDLPGREWSWDAAASRWQIREPSATGVLGSVLGLAELDVDGDGLLDVVSVVDARATPDGVVPFLDPGGVLRRCAPDEGCGFETRRFAEGFERFGSFMGIESLVVGGVRRLVLGNVGPFGVFEWGGSSMQPADLPQDAAWFGEDYLAYKFSWGGVSIDLNDDDQQELIVAFGHATLPLPEGSSAHQDTVFEVTDDGRLVPSTRWQLAPQPTQVDPVSASARQSRSIVRADFDGDGRQEVLVTATNGAPLVYTHIGAEPRCSVRPRARVVWTSGTGYAWRRPGGDWLDGPIHGENRGPDAPVVIAAATSGELRFPSGAVAPFACEGTARVVVEEPDWLDVTATSSLVVVDIAEEHWPEEVREVEVALRTAVGVEVVSARLVSAGYLATATASGTIEAVMVRVGDRWVQRWFEASDEVEE